MVAGVQIAVDMAKKEGRDDLDVGYIARQRMSGPPE
jgi:hypothetical protein